MVAKSYQNLEQIDEPYLAAGRWYVKVRMNNGSIKQVRWYSETEYKRMYPQAATTSDKNFKPQKEVLGFTNGYITIFKGNTYEDHEYFKASCARYTRWWGWYIISTDTVPLDLPDDVEPIRLPWSLVGKDDGSLKSETEVIAAVESLIYDADSSTYQGVVGERLERVLTVKQVVELNGTYGTSTMHIMRDADNNCYVWTTKTRSWAVDSVHRIIGTVKEQRQYKGVKQTILTRCREKE